MAEWERGPPALNVSSVASRSNDRFGFSEIDTTDFTRQLRQHLKASGWRFHREAKGDHEIWINPATGVKVTVDGKVRNRALANKILKDAGLGKKF